MKKSNKGFTLVELLAIILIIAIIGVIAVPNISKQMKKNEDRQKRLLNQRITNAAHTYAAKYYADKMVKGYYESLSGSSEPDGSSYIKNIAKFTLKQLEQDGLLDLSGEECSGKKNDDNAAIEVNVDDESNIHFYFGGIEADDCVDTSIIDGLW